MASTPAYVPSNPFYRVVYKITILLVVLILLVATALALRLLWQRAVHPPDLILLAVMYALVALGVTVGYHRMLTHRSFRAHPVVKLVLLILGSMAFEGPASNGRLPIPNTMRAPTARVTRTARSTASFTHTSAGSSVTATPIPECTAGTW